MEYDGDKLKRILTEVGCDLEHAKALYDFARAGYGNVELDIKKIKEIKLILAQHTKDIAFDTGWENVVVEQYIAVKKAGAKLFMRKLMSLLRDYQFRRGIIRYVPNVSALLRLARCTLKELESIAKIKAVDKKKRAIGKLLREAK